MTWRALTLSLVLLVPALVRGQEARPPRIELDLRAGQVEVEDLLHHSARSLGAVAVIESRVRGRKITLHTPWRGTFPWRAVEHVLHAHGAHAQLLWPRGRKAAGLLSVTQACPDPASLRCLKAQTPRGPAQVTGVFAVEHGAGTSIYACLRGIVTGPHGQSPDLLYLPRPEQILVTGSRTEVRHAAHTIRELDVVGQRLSLRSLRVGADQAKQVACALKDLLLARRRAAPVKDLLWRSAPRAPWAEACGDHVCVAGSREEIALAEQLLPLLTGGEPKAR